MTPQATPEPIAATPSEPPNDPSRVTSIRNTAFIGATMSVLVVGTIAGIVAFNLGIATARQDTQHQPAPTVCLDALRAADELALELSISGPLVSDSIVGNGPEKVSNEKRAAYVAAASACRDGK